MAHPAPAFELDALLPDNVPGYGAPFAVTGVEPSMRGADASGWRWGPWEVNPRIDLGAGFDSLPNGVAGASPVWTVAPNVAFADTATGFGSYLGGDWDQYPAQPAQTHSDIAAALGQAVVLPAERITVSAAYVTGRETGFDVGDVALAQPLAFAVTNLRASDRMIAGLFTVTPELGLTDFRFSSAAAQNRVDYREGLTAGFSAGGPGQIVTRLLATQSRYRDTALNADTAEALAGLSDAASGLWTFRALAGVARRQAGLGLSLTAPVFEAAADWAPGDFDRVRLGLAREIDDPDELTAAPDTLTEISLSLSHEVPDNFALSVSAQGQNAAFLHSALRETLMNFETTASWPLNGSWALQAEYLFDDRQANHLRAANEHVITLGLVWTP